MSETLYVTMYLSTARMLNGAVEFYADTQRTITTEVSVSLSCDTSRSLSVTTKLWGDTQRDLTGYVTLSADTRRVLPYKLTDYFTSGVRQVSLMLQERTLSDRFQIEANVDANVGDTIAGTLVDFPINFAVESTSKKDIMMTCTGMYQQDKLLNQPVVFSITEDDCTYYRARIQPRNYPVGGQTKGAYASTILRKVAAGLNMPLVMNFSDFVPSSFQPSYSAEYDTDTISTSVAHHLNWEIGSHVDITETFEAFEAYTTYQSVLSSLFSWYSTAPRMGVNVFVRDGTIYALQRGRESTTTDLTDLPHTRPTVKREIVRTCWAGNANDSEGGSEFVWGDWYIASITEPANTVVPKSPVKSLTKSNSDGSRTVNTYTYDTTSRGSWLNKAYSVTYDSSGTEIGRATTDYEMQDTGQRYGHTYDGNNVPIADTLDNYQYPDFPSDLMQQWWMWWQTGSIISLEQNYEWKTVEGNTIAGSSSVAVEDAEMREAIYEEVVWMNRRVKETVTLDIVDNFTAVSGDTTGQGGTINHIFDFDSRYTLDDNEYFLVSNRVSYTPRQLIQSLTLVRWG